ncbi:MAG: hypothetical protein ACK4NY_09315 [Spirosomataceae bacterium]
MKTTFYRTPCKSWYYSSSEEHKIAIFNAVAVPSISKLTTCPAKLYTNLIKISREEFELVRNKVLKKLESPIEYKERVFEANYFADYASL